MTAILLKTLLMEINVMSNTDTIDNTTDAVFGAFAKAAQAMQRLPEVEAKLKEITERCERSEDTIDIERGVSKGLMEKLEALEAAFAQKEAELASATFRHGELAKVVNAISGLLPVQPAPASSDASLIHEQKDSSVVDPTSVTEVNSDTKEPSPVHGAEGQREADPTNVSSVAQSAGNVEHVANTDSGGGNAITETASEASLTNPNPTEVSNAEPTPAPTLAPSASTENHGTPAPEPDALQTLNNISLVGIDPTASEASPSHTDLPHAGSPDWRKPWGMTWAEYVRLGGSAPAWMADPANNHAV